jgi:hypothetical protein
VKPELHEIKHQFLDLAPPNLEPGILYISVKYKNMIHLCCCGCGHKVVTPISPTGWQLTFDGKAVSVYPSIGNWQLACQSHYVISSGRVQWAGRWSKEMIAAGFARDRQAKQNYYDAPPPQEPTVPEPRRKGRGVIAKIKEWWS